MNFILAHVGTLKEAYFREAFAEYQKRISAFGTLEEVVLKPAKTGTGELSEEEKSVCLETESEEFQKLLSSPKCARAYKIALCIEGREKSSEELAGVLEECKNTGKSTVVLLVGGSWGMSEKVKALCDLRLSFSRMTFAHSLFSVMLAEQLYRALSILAGSKYHK